MEQRSPEWYDIRKGKLTASQAGAWLAESPECRLTVAEIKGYLEVLDIPFPKTAKRDELLALGVMESADNTPPTNEDIFKNSIWPTSHLKGTVDARNTAICKILGSMAKCQAPDQWEVDPNGEPPRNPALWAVWNGIRQERAALESFQEWSGLSAFEVGFCEHKTGIAGCSPDALIEGHPIGFEGKAPLPQTHIKYLLMGELPPEYFDQVHFSMAVTGAQQWWFQSYCEGLPPFRIPVVRSDYTERMVQGIEEFSECLESAREEIAALYEEEYKRTIAKEDAV